LPGGLRIGRQRPYEDADEVILRAKLDALAFAGFQFDGADAQILFADFKNTNEAVPLEYRHTVLDLMGDS
jgi:hypothetical protein